MNGKVFHVEEKWTDGKNLNGEQAEDDTFSVRFSVGTEVAICGSMKNERKEMIDDEDEQVETICHFCGEKYYFSKEELREILKLTKKVK